jgi:hypothetical protein
MSEITIKEIFIAWEHLSLALIERKIEEIFDSKTANTLKKLSKKLVSTGKNAILRKS